MMQALENTYLFVVSCKIKYITYIVSWRLMYKSQWKGGKLPQSVSLYCRGNLSCEE
jgi:hypothetical protein